MCVNETTCQHGNRTGPPTFADPVDEQVDDEAEGCHEDPQDQNEEPVDDIGKDFQLNVSPGLCTTAKKEKQLHEISIL